MTASKTIEVSKAPGIPVRINSGGLPWVVIGGGREALAEVKKLRSVSKLLLVRIVAEEISPAVKNFFRDDKQVRLHERKHDGNDLSQGVLIIATGNAVLDEIIFAEARPMNKLIFLPSNHEASDFVIPVHVPAPVQQGWIKRNTDQGWKKIASRLILVFVLMVTGHVIISYLPLPPVSEIWTMAQDHFDYRFLFFVLAGFLAQMVDGMLSMGYGVTSATCLMSFGVNPVAVSAAIHTSEIFTSGISGYSHYKFGNVNKKLFRHLVIPGVIGAICGALLLVFLGDHYSNYLLPIIAIYAGFLGLKILVKAFQVQPKNVKAKRIGWLAGTGGFLDSFGGGGWGPIVTSNLISKGRSPKYTVGSVSLTEFFVTLASAFTFFVTVGVSHWSIVLGLIVGGVIAAPIAARFAGRLPRKTMMILVGIMVMVWCARMLVKSIF